MTAGTEANGWEPEPDDCVDSDGEVWPEHDYGSTECRRCGAEPDEDPQ